MIDLVERLENLILHRGDMISLGFEAAAEIKRLRSALNQCEQWFREYGDSHARKGDDDKASRNYSRAEVARNAYRTRPDDEGAEEAERLYNLLLRDGERYVYKTIDDSWAVTCGGGVFSARAVYRLLAERRIRSRYSSTPYEAYTTGKTIDMAATLKARKLNRKAELVYVEEPQK